MTRGVERSENAACSPCWGGFNTPASSPGVKAGKSMRQMQRKQSAKTLRLMRGGQVPRVNGPEDSRGKSDISAGFPTPAISSVYTALPSLQQEKIEIRTRPRITIAKILLRPLCMKK